MAFVEWPDRQYRKHANAKSATTGERRFDTTALHSDLHGNLISHADWTAHNEKWDYVWRQMKLGERILDIGCGTDTPLMKAINYVQSQSNKVLRKNGGCYVGADMNKLKPTGISWATLIGQCDLTSDDGYNAVLDAANPDAGESGELQGYSMIVCLEVIEHMMPEDGFRLLCNMRDLLSPGGTIYLSTPVYDGVGQARNHLWEYRVAEIAELIDLAQLSVVNRMGTFTAEPQVKRWLKANRPDWLEVYNASRRFHSAGYLSGLFAPMLPDESRNNLWELQQRGNQEVGGDAREMGEAPSEDEGVEIL